MQINLVPRPSRRLIVLLTLLHIAALLVLPLLMAPLLLLLVIALFVIGSWLYSLKRHVFASGIREIVCDVEDQWVIVMNDGKQFSATLNGDTVVHPWLVILSLKPATGLSKRIVLLPDSLDKTTFRRLRVILKTHAQDRRG